MSAEAEVLAAQDARFAAMVARDLATLDAMLDDGLTYIHASGKADDKPAFLRAVEGRGYIALARRSAAVRLLGDVAIVTALVDIHVTPELRFDAQVTDVWQRQAGRWRNVAWQSTRAPQA